MKYWSKVHVVLFKLKGMVCSFPVRGSDECDRATKKTTCSIVEISLF